MLCVFSKYIMIFVLLRMYMNISAAKNMSGFAFAIRNVFNLTVDVVKIFSTKRLSLFSEIWILI